MRSFFSGKRRQPVLSDSLFYLTEDAFCFTREQALLGLVLNNGSAEAAGKWLQDDENQHLVVAATYAGVGAPVKLVGLDHVAGSTAAAGGGGTAVGEIRGIIVAYEEQTERFVVDVSQECFEHQSDPIRSVRAENLELLPAAGATTSSTTAESSRESGDTKPATATTRRASENAAKLRANVAALQKKMTDGMAAKMKKWGEGKSSQHGASSSASQRTKSPQLGHDTSGIVPSPTAIALKKQEEKEGKISSSSSMSTTKQKLGSSMSFLKEKAANFRATSKTSSKKINWGGGRLGTGSSSTASTGKDDRDAPSTTSTKNGTKLNLQQIDRQASYAGSVDSDHTLIAAESGAGGGFSPNATLSETPSEKSTPSGRGVVSSKGSQAQGVVTGSLGSSSSSTSSSSPGRAQKRSHEQEPVLGSGTNKIDQEQRKNATTLEAFLEKELSRIDKKKEELDTREQLLMMREYKVELREQEVAEKEASLQRETVAAQQRIALQHAEALRMLSTESRGRESASSASSSCSSSADFDIASAKNSPNSEGAESATEKTYSADWGKLGAPASAAESAGVDIAETMKMASPDAGSQAETTASSPAEAPPILSP